MDISEAYELKDIFLRPDQLLLDPTNPRIILSTNDEIDGDPIKLANDKIQDYILQIVDKDEFHVAEVTNSIRKDGYIAVGNKMIVEKIKGTDKYLVLEGNRRTAAIKHLLQDRQSLAPNVRRSLEKIPVQELLFTERGNGSREQVKFKILGLIHLTGALPWGAMERAYYIYRSYMSNVKETHGFNDNFVYYPDCSHQVAEFLKISPQKVRKDLAVYRVYEQLRSGKFNVRPDHYSLLDLAVGAREMNCAYFGLDQNTLEFTKSGLNRFATLCLEKKSPINNPQEFKAFVKIWSNGTENDVSLVESGDNVFDIWSRVQKRMNRNLFLDQLREIRDQLEELMLAEFRDTAQEVKVIREIESLVNERLCNLITDSIEDDDIDVKIVFPPKSVKDALRLGLDKYEIPIIEIMKKRPNCTCVREKLPIYLLKVWDIKTWGEPREKFCDHVEKAIQKLLAKGTLQAYTATNDRLRLLK